MALAWETLSVDEWESMTLDGWVTLLLDPFYSLEAGPGVVVSLDSFGAVADLSGVGAVYSEVSDGR